MIPCEIYEGDKLIANFVFGSPAELFIWIKNNGPIEIEIKSLKQPFVLTRFSRRDYGD